MIILDQILVGLWPLHVLEGYKLLDELMIVYDFAGKMASPNCKA